MNIADFIKALNSAEDFRKLRDIGIELTKAIGCDYFMYAGIGQLPISSPELTIIGNYPQQWVMRYQEKEYARIDPTVWHAAHSVVPLFWCDLAPPDDVVSQFFQDARAHGLVSGVTIPLHSGSGYSAILTFVSTSANESVYETLQSEIPHLLLFGHHLHNIVMRQHIPAGQSNERGLLSETERRCLLWASEGKTTWEIGKILSIKERTVVFHLDNAAKKLGAVNRQHAIACAIALGELRAIIATIPDKIKF